MEGQSAAPTCVNMLTMGTYAQHRSSRLGVILPMWRSGRHRSKVAALAAGARNFLPAGVGRPLMRSVVALLRSIPFVRGKTMELISESFPGGSYKKENGLRVRPVPEWKTCLVYTPEHPRIVRLNAHAWLIFELCDGRDLTSMEAEYLAAIGGRFPAEMARDHLLNGLNELIGQGLVKAIPPTDLA